MKSTLPAAYHADDLMSFNIIAEIPGSDLKDEIVMLGAHFDSWHSGTGATDNAVGCAVGLEAVRILQAIGAKPRRTIRIALWTGEEQGLLGSKAYVADHFGRVITPTRSGERSRSRRLPGQVATPKTNQPPRRKTKRPRPNRRRSSRPMSKLRMPNRLKPSQPMSSQRSKPADVKATDTKAADAKKLTPSQLRRRHRANAQRTSTNSSRTTQNSRLFQSRQRHRQNPRGLPARQRSGAARSSAPG